MYHALSEADYEREWGRLVAALPPEHHAYFTYHKRRFYELFDSLAQHTAGLTAPLVLEVGVSGFTRLYRRLLPGIRLVTLDRPVAMYGESAAYTVGECGAERHYNLDLNRQPLDPTWGEPPLGQFDYVVFCEVLEHLLVSPVQVIEELLSLLRPDGLLYLTTPNFFSIHRWRQMLQRDHPQSPLPRRGQDHAASTHFRESSMAELVSAVEQAGGKLVHAAYSDCWEDEATRRQVADTPALWANLVLLVSRGDSAQPPDATVEAVRATFGPLSNAERRVLGLQPLPAPSPPASPTPGWLTRLAQRIEARHPRGRR